MEIVYTLDAKEDIDYWKKSGNAVRLRKIRSLIENILKTPFEGIGKPEPLKYSLTGTWSRRIDREHLNLNRRLECFGFTLTRD